MVEKNGNQLVWEFTEDLGAMTSDPVKLKQILLNLIGNSGKFTEQGRVLLNVCRLAGNGSQWFRFQVKDTGIGIASENQAKLFNSFTQADASTTRKYGGTGLGLTITKRFVEMMGGTISVESALGKGATFEVCLPAEIQEIHKTFPEITPRLS
jgi:signal transduction histidine kinase